MIIEGRGDMAAAQKLLADQGVIRPSVQAVLDKLKGIPVDIDPQYATAQELGQ
jgi:heat shock protein HspQ